MVREFIAAILAASLLTSSAAAFHLANTDWSLNTVLTPGLNNDHDTQASMLQELGLFRSTEEGFDLYRTMTREEAAVMIVRFLGAEEEAQQGSWEQPFTDVHAWAKPYVGWLYQKGFASGVSKIRYGADRDILGPEFATLLNRALTGKDDYLSSGLLTTAEDHHFRTEGGFMRVEAVAIATRALTLPLSRDGEEGGTLASRLVQKGTFTAEQLGRAAFCVLPTSFHYEDGHIVSRICGVTYARCPLNGLRFDTGMDDNLEPYLYAYQVQAGVCSIYRLELPTLEASLAATCDLPEDAVQMADSCFIARLQPTEQSAAGAKPADYLLLQYQDLSGNPHMGGLMRIEDGMAEMVLPASALGDHATIVSPDDQWGGSSFDLSAISIIAQGQLFTVRHYNTVSIAAPEGDIIYQDASCVVTQQTSKDGVTTLMGISPDTGECVDRYQIVPDATGARHAAYHKDGRWIYGEAGLYFVNEIYLTTKNVGATGRLTQLTDRPVVEVKTVRWGAGSSPRIS